MKRHIRFICLAIFITCLAVYNLTVAVYPVNIADSNELIMAASSNGIAHPPSYPLYIVFLRSIFLIPWGNLAHVANGTSALFQALSLSVLYLLIIRLLKITRTNLDELSLQIISVTSVFVLAFSYFYWDLSTYAEVFGLYNLFIGLSLLLIFSLPQNKSNLLPWEFFGIAASHHQLILILLPGYIYLIKQKSKTHAWIKYVLAFSITFIIPYLLMFALSDKSAPLSWFTESSLPGLWNLVSRGIYTQVGSSIETYANTINVGHSLTSIIILFRYVTQHVTVVPLFLAAIGLRYIRSKNNPLYKFFLITLIISGPLLAAYLKFPLLGQTNDQMFYHGTYLRLRMFTLFEYIIMSLMPFGIIGTIKLLSRYNSNAVKYSFLIFLIIPLYLLVQNYPLVNKKFSDFDSNYYRLVIESTPKDGALIVDSDVVFGLLYQQVINQHRPDVLIIPTAMHMRWGYLQNYLPKEIFNITGYYKLILSITEWGVSQNRPVLVFDPTPRFINQLRQFNYVLTPNGYLLNITRTPIEIHDYDYGLSKQLAESFTGEEELWSLGRKGIFHTIHMNLAYSYQQYGATNKADYHTELANELRQNSNNFSSYMQIYNQWK